VRSWEALETVNDLPRLELARRLRPRAAR
jgi:hypothetical protein